MVFYNLKQYELQFLCWNSFNEECYFLPNDKKILGFYISVSHVLRGKPFRSLQWSGIELLSFCTKLICFIFLEREIFLLTKIKEFLKSYSSLKFQIHTELSYLQVFEANKILKNIAHIALKLQNCFKHS